jgi:glycosyltransferase involved in cell wall biosynthesis
MPAPRILIVSTGPLCRNPRVLKEADALGAAGLDTTVLTLTDTEQFEAYDRALLAHAPFRKIAIALHGTGPTNGFMALARRGQTWLARRLVRLGWQSPHALGPALGPLGRAAGLFAADLTIVHTEVPFCVGARLLTDGRRVAADFEDWHSRDLLPSAQLGRPLRLLARVERALLHGCAYTSTTSHALAAGLHAVYGGARPVVITNSFPLPRPPPARLADPRGPAFFWFSQTIGPGRGLEAFLAAWTRTTHSSRLCLLGQIGASYREQLLRAVPEDWRNRLQFLPIVSPEELPAVITRHDLGLALEPTEPASRDLTITNKIFQYFGAGLGVIASATAGQREVLARAPDAGHIVTLTETAAVTALLDELLADPARLTAMGAAARRAAEEFYCWEKNAPLLVTSVKAALNTPTP